jgi:hypothetical protein
MVRHLQELGEEQAAHWFRTYWCGERGTWTIGDASVGHCAHNNGVEGHWPGFTSAVCGSGGKSKSLKVDIMVGNTIKYVHDVSKETAEKQIQEFGSHRFLRDPEMTSSQWSALQLADIRMLRHAHLYGTARDLKRWHRWIETLCDLDGPQGTPPGGALLSQKIQRYHDDYSLPDIDRTDIECFIVPSKMGLKAMDVSGMYKTDEALGRRLASLRAVYYDLVVTPDQIEAKHPGITANDMLSLLDTFNVIQPDVGGFKCNCKEFFRDGICSTAMLFKMLWYPDCMVPDKYSVVKIPARPSSRRPGVFAAASAEPTFQDKDDIPSRMWHPTGLAGADAAGSDSESPKAAAAASMGRVGRFKRKAVILKPPAARAAPKPAESAPDEDDIVKNGMNRFLRGVDPPARFYSPEREMPPRIAAMSEEQRYFYTEWLSDIRKRRAQVRLRPTPAPHYLTLLTPPSLPPPLAGPHGGANTPDAGTTDGQGPGCSLREGYQDEGTAAAQGPRHGASGSEAPDSFAGTVTLL